MQCFLAYFGVTGTMSLQFIFPFFFLLNMPINFGKVHSNFA